MRGGFETNNNTGLGLNYDLNTLAALRRHTCVLGGHDYVIVLSLAARRQWLSDDVQCETVRHLMSGNFLSSFFLSKIQCVFFFLDSAAI